VTRYLRTEMVPLDQLTPFPGNARRGRVDVIMDSIQANGQYRSIVVREVKNGPLIVVAGNHTMRAVEQLNGTQIRCELYEMTDAEARRINLVDNRSNDLAEDDDEALADLLRELGDDHAGTGYTAEEIAELVGDIGDALTSSDQMPSGVDQDDPVPEMPQEVATRTGDVWTLGAHRLMCGDCRDPKDVTALLAGSVVNLAFTSPPYASQRDYDDESEFRPIPPDDYVEWFAPVADQVKEHLAPDGSWFVNIKSSVEGLDTHLYVHDLVLAHAREWGWHFATELCWSRIGVPKMVSRRFKNQFEPVYQFALGDWKIRPNAVRHESDSVPTPGVERPPKASRVQGESAGALAIGRKIPKMSDAQGSGGAQPIGTPRAKKRGTGTSQTMSDVQGEGKDVGEYIAPGLAYPGNLLPTFSRDHTATGHTAAFPVGLPQFFVLAYTDAGDVVYDPFSGSGSTILACERAGRLGFGMEISAKYCDLTAKRYQDVTGTVPLLNGEPYDFTT
jgi:DNA modification methylase